MVAFCECECSPGIYNIRLCDMRVHGVLVLLVVTASHNDSVHSNDSVWCVLFFFFRLQQCILMWVLLALLTPRLSIKYATWRYENWHHDMFDAVYDTCHAHHTTQWAAHTWCVVRICEMRWSEQNNTPEARETRLSCSVLIRTPKLSNIFSQNSFFFLFDGQTRFWGHLNCKNINKHKTKKREMVFSTGLWPLAWSSPHTLPTRREQKQILNVEIMRRFRAALWNNILSIFDISINIYVSMLYLYCTSIGSYKPQTNAPWAMACQTDKKPKSKTIWCELINCTKGVSEMIIILK